MLLLNFLGSSPWTCLLRGPNPDPGQREAAAFREQAMSLFTHKIHDYTILE